MTSLTPAQLVTLRAVAQAIIDSGYAVPVVTRRDYKPAAQRLAQLQACRDKFIMYHGYAPNQYTLARMMGISTPSVSRLIKHGRNGK